MDGTDPVVQRQLLEIGDRGVIGLVQIINLQTGIYFQLIAVFLFQSFLSLADTPAYRLLDIFQKVSNGSGEWEEKRTHGTRVLWRISRNPPEYFFHHKKYNDYGSY